MYINTCECLYSFSKITVYTAVWVFTYPYICCYITKLELGWAARFVKAQWIVHLSVQKSKASSTCILLKLLFFRLSAFCTHHWQMLIALWCHLKSWSFADTVSHLWRSDASWLWCVPQCAGMKASISYYSWELEIAGWPSANPGSQLQLGQGMPQSHYFYPTNTPHSGVLRKQL